MAFLLFCEDEVLLLKLLGLAQVETKSEAHLGPSCAFTGGLGVEVSAHGSELEGWDLTKLHRGGLFLGIVLHFCIWLGAAH